MNNIIFATNNRNKVREMQSILGSDIEIVSLKEAGIDIDIPEPHDTLEANAAEKSRTIFNLTGKSCFSEDTGLEVKSLNGAPGVKSARYAGDQCDNEKNIAKLIQELVGKNDRTARFRTVISLIIDQKEFQFEGICDGHIAERPIGEKGFGYDPVFIPDGSERCFAEMDLEEKNKFSHRKKASIKLIRFLKDHYGKNQN